jgi:UDP-N-acetylglucosamine 1-carboxyvinyltransferase
LKELKILADEHRVLPDMIEIGSWIGLAAMTRSEITIKDVSWDNLLFQVL